ncbi:hypothetical protein FRB95_014753 [Tulasnella sp. JGI-2019a]|nr:hypothetical protein FRB95_014753 [Tulasnella sp. JGI-2019a]
MDSRSKIFNRTGDGAIFCQCPLLSPPKTSTTAKNPGRVYYNCPKEMSDPERCKFFKWKDEIVSSQSSSPMKPTSPSKPATAMAVRTPVKTNTASIFGGGSGRGGPSTNTTPVTGAAEGISRMMTNRSPEEKRAAGLRRRAAIQAVINEVAPTQLQTQASIARSSSPSASLAKRSRATEPSSASGSGSVCDQVRRLPSVEEPDHSNDDSMEVDIMMDTDDDDTPEGVRVTARNNGRTAPDDTLATAARTAKGKGKEKMRARTPEEEYIVVNEQGSPTKKHKGLPNVKERSEESEDVFDSPARALDFSSRASEASSNGTVKPSKPIASINNTVPRNPNPNNGNGSDSGTTIYPDRRRSPSPGPGAPSTPRAEQIRSKTSQILSSLRTFQEGIPDVESHIELLERRLVAADKSNDLRSREIQKLRDANNGKDEMLKVMLQEKRDLETKLRAQEKRIRSLEEALEHHKTGAKDA